MKYNGNLSFDAMKHGYRVIGHKLPWAEWRVLSFHKWYLAAIISAWLFTQDPWAVATVERRFNE